MDLENYKNAKKFESTARERVSTNAEEIFKMNFLDFY